MEASPGLDLSAGHMFVMTSLPLALDHDNYCQTQFEKVIAFEN